MEFAALQNSRSNLWLRILIVGRIGSSDCYCCENYLAMYWVWNFIHVLTSLCHSLWRHLKTHGRGTQVLEANLAQLHLDRHLFLPSIRPRAMERHLRELPWVDNGIRVLEGSLLLPFTTDLRCPLLRAKVEPLKLNLDLTGLGSDQWRSFAGRWLCSE